MRGKPQVFRPWSRFLTALAAAILVAALVSTTGSSTAAAGLHRWGHPVPVAAATGLDRAGAPAWVAVDQAPDAGFGVASIKTWSASTVDFNLDGAEDVLIGYHLHGAKLWMNLGDGHYQRVASSGWPTRFVGQRVTDRHNCDWADVDLNGLPDAYCAAGRTLANRVKRGMENELWLQTAPGAFHEVGAKWHVTDICGRGRAVAFLDANGDRYPDLFLGNETPRRVRDTCDRSPTLPNEESKLFINDHGAGFRYAPKVWHHGAGPGSRCAEVLDFNHERKGRPLRLPRQRIVASPVRPPSRARIRRRDHGEPPAVPDQRRHPR